jgi:hypothetical protein
MTKPTGQPKGRPVVTPLKGQPVDAIIEDKIVPPEFLCYACSAGQSFQFKYCPLCGVENRWA